MCPSSESDGKADHLFERQESSMWMREEFDRLSCENLQIVALRPAECRPAAMMA